MLGFGGDYTAAATLSGFGRDDGADAQNQYEGANTMNIGDKVTWKSQSAGVWKEKTGEVVAFIPPNKSAKPILETLGIKYPSNRVKFQSLSELDQVVVEVPRGGRSNMTDFYAPRKTQVSVVE